MATGLVKWWRARFLAGYRPFSVVGTNTEGSDSEELLTGVPTACNVSSPPTTESQPILISPVVESPQVAPDSTSVPAGPTGNDEQPTCGTTKQLSFEEFECDVSVADGGDRRRQEFSFTLYDFDGHGKITKDDIAGLVTTIYDTLGASIQVPPCGSKTIKVKLTVSPDQRASSSSSQAPRNAAGTCLNATQTPQANATPLPGHAHHQPNPSASSCCHLKHAAPCSHATAATATARHGASRVRLFYLVRHFDFHCSPSEKKWRPTARTTMRMPERIECSRRSFVEESVRCPIYHLPIQIARRVM